MSKKFTKAICGMMCLAMASSAVLGLAACGGATVDDGEQTLFIWVSETGYGSKWLYDAVDSFKQQAWVKEKYPELKTSIVPNTTDGTFGFETTVAGAGVNSYDLIASVAAGGSYYGSGQFEDLSSLYDSEVPGEGISLRDKMLDEIYFQQGYEQLDGSTKYYCVPWTVGTMGLFYNETVIKRAFGENYDMPNTTDELVQFCYDLKAKGEVPIISSTSANYWSEMFKLWWAQYNGIEDYTNFWYGINSDGDYDGEVTGQLGRKYSLMVINSLLNAGNGLIHDECTIRDYKTMQTFFLVGRGAIMANGDWLANEMEGEDSSAIRMMKTPVISHVIERCTSVKTDAALSFVVDCVDAGDDFETAATKYAQASLGELKKADYNVIKEARNATAVYGGLGYHIPKYATAKEVAKDFIRYCATDEGIKVIMDAGKGFLSAYDYTPSDADMATYNTLSRDSLTYAKTAKFIPPHTMFRLFCYGGLIPIRTTVNQVDSIFMADNPKDRLDPVAIYQSDYDFYAKNNYSGWNDVLRKAGII